jgi:hypothetical protein
MNAVIAFLLGVLFVILILLPFWILSAEFPTISNAWLSIMAKQAITYNTK